MTTTIKPWRRTDIPSQKGKLAVITGATGGIGYETALALASAGAAVIIAARNPDKGQAAMLKIIGQVPNADVCFEQIDLASLDSVRAFAERLVAQQRPLDILINNAAVMNTPKRRETPDGFELQLATNYLGHFALTARLLPLLRRAEGARVITFSSVAARSGLLRFDDLQSQHHYKPMAAYAQSKLACLMFAFELQRRSDAEGWGIESVAAHPGIARTDLLRTEAVRWSAAGIARTLLWFLFQPAAQGALPGLFAATSPDAEGGGYYGPGKLGETRGSPAIATSPSQALDAAAAARLWTVSERLSGVNFKTN